MNPKFKQLTDHQRIWLSKIINDNCFHDLSIMYTVPGTYTKDEINMIFNLIKQVLNDEGYFTDTAHTLAAACNVYWLYLLKVKSAL